jgi:hypothetical protein
MATVFSPGTPLEHHVYSGHYERTIDCIRAMPAGERKSQRASLLAMQKLLDAARWASDDARYAGWGTAPTQAQSRAAHGALVLCGTAKDVAAGFVDIDDLIALASEFDPPSLAGLADALLEAGPYNIRTVQRLIAAGVVARPDGDGYALGLIALPRACGPKFSMADFFAQDPGLKGVALRVFDVEGTSDVSLASIDKYQHDTNAWSRILLSLCAEGVFTRAILLDKTLDCLGHDWPQFRSGWFSRFHAELAPTLDEVRPRANRYLRMLASRIPPTVTMALEVVKRLAAADLIDPHVLAEALQPVMASGTKGQLEAVLKLCEAVRQRAPSAAHALSLTACAGLFHESPELQKKILQRLDTWGADEAVRAELRRYLPGIAATNRALLVALIGDADEPQLPTAPGADRRQASATMPAQSVLDDSRVLTPADGPDPLVERIAHVFEHDGDIDAFECAAAALARLAPLPAEVLASLAPVLKRAGRLRSPVASELARLLVFVTDGRRLEAEPMVDHGGNPSAVHALLIARTQDLMDLAAQGKRVTPLSTPTHCRGFIAPGLLIERVRAHQQHGAASTRDEQALALLRLAPAATDEDRRLARTLDDSPFTRALRYALGDAIAPGGDEVLFTAAARIRHPGADDDVLAAAFGDAGPDGARVAGYDWQVTSRSSSVGTTTYHHHDLIVRALPDRQEKSEHLAVMRHPPPNPKARRHYRWWSFAGIDEALIRYASTLLPSALEAYFAEGARALGNNLDWREAQWQNKAYLEPLLDATVRPGPMATLMLGLALAGKEPGQTALAIDCLVKAHAQGRLDLSLLAGTLQRLLATPLVKAPRYRKSLEAALRIDPSVSSAVIELLSAAMTAGSPGEAPKDLASLLELLQELLVSEGKSLPESTKKELAALKLSGKGRALQKALLGNDSSASR